MNRAHSFVSASLATALTLSLLLAGCDRGRPESFDHPPSSSPPSAKAPRSTSAAKTSAPTSDGAAGATKTTRLDGLNLEITVDGTRPASITESKLLGTMVSAGEATASIAKAKPTQASTVEAEKKAAAVYKPKNLSSEKLADGWYVTYENTGSMGANYFLTVYRTIGGTAYRCTTTTPNEAARNAALEMCKSLKQ